MKSDNIIVVLGFVVGGISALITQIVFRYLTSL